MAIKNGDTAAQNQHSTYQNELSDIIAPTSSYPLVGLHYLNLPRLGFPRTRKG